MQATLAIRERLEDVAEGAEAFIDGAALRQGHADGMSLALALTASQVSEAELAVQTCVAPARSSAGDEGIDEEVRPAALRVHAGAADHLHVVGMVMRAGRCSFTPLAAGSHGLATCSRGGTKVPVYCGPLRLNWGAKAFC